MLPFPAMIGLAALGVPRVILHDLHLIPEGGPLTWSLAILPVAVWVAVVLIAKVEKPFLTLVAIGVLFGAMLVVTHQILWISAFSGAPPVVNGSAVFPRIAAVFSGLSTGTALGAIAGTAALAARALAGMSNPHHVR